MSNDNDYKERARYSARSQIEEARRVLGIDSGYDPARRIQPVIDQVELVARAVGEISKVACDEAGVPDVDQLYQDMRDYLRKAGRES